MTRSEIVDLLDAYFLGTKLDRSSVFAQVATWKPDIEEAAPIVRAIALVGARAADESLMALRLLLAGHAALDERVMRLRTFIALAAKGDPQGIAGYHNLLSPEAT